MEIKYNGDDDCCTYFAGRGNSIKSARWQENLRSYVKSLDDHENSHKNFQKHH